MRTLGAAALVLWAAAALGAQSPGVAWVGVPAAGEAEARSLGKPLVLLWQAGPGAAEFTQEADRLWTTWPGWTDQARLAAVFVRGRSWEAPLPVSFPPLPDNGRSSVLMVWDPQGGEPTVWTEVPPALAFSRTLARVSGRDLEDPYTLDVEAYTWGDTVLTRVGDGPLWVEEGPDGPADWVEEGPLGSVLVLAERPAGRRAAFPLDDGPSYLYDPKDRSWAPWNPVLVKRP